MFKYPIATTQKMFNCIWVTQLYLSPSKIGLKKLFLGSVPKTLMIDPWVWYTDKKVISGFSLRPKSSAHGFGPVFHRCYQIWNCRIISFREGTRVMVVDKGCRSGWDDCSSAYWVANLSRLSAINWCDWTDAQTLQTVHCSSVGCRGGIYFANFFVRITFARLWW